MLSGIHKVHQGYWPSNALRAQTMNLLNLAREMRAERRWITDREGVARYCVPDVRYIPLTEERDTLIKRIPDGITERAYAMCVRYLVELYQN